MSARAGSLPKGLVAAVLAMTLTVLGLGGAILVIKLKPAELSTSANERAIEVWQEVVARAPEDDEAHVGLGLAFVDAGRLDDARGEFEEAIGLNGENWVALAHLGLLVQDAEPERALDLFDRAAKAAPTGDKVAALVYAGDLLMAQGDTAGAKRAYSRAVGDSPITFDAHLGLAKALEALGDTEGALAEYQEASQYDPSNAEIAAAIARLQAGN